MAPKPFKYVNQIELVLVHQCSPINRWTESLWASGDNLAERALQEGA
jgi:hypothetical protein